MEKYIFIAGVAGTNNWRSVYAKDADDAISHVKEFYGIKANAAKQVGTKFINNDTIL